MSERVDRSNPVISQLRKLKGCVLLRVELRDGTDRKVDVPKQGNRWDKLSKLLDSMPWDTIEAQDKDGKTLGVIEADEDLFDDEEEDTGSGRVAEFKAMAHVCRDIMRDTMKETRAMFQVQTDGQAHLMTAIVEGLRSVQDSYSLALKVQAAHLAGGGDAGTEVQDMMKMAFAMAMAPKPPPSVPPPPKNANPKPGVPQ